MPPRLAQDHSNARFLAEGLAAIDGIAVDPKAVETNIVVFCITNAKISATAISTELKRRRILINPIGVETLRAVTHYDVTRADCEVALEALAQILRN
jgi:threonine aldolase